MYICNVALAIVMELIAAQRCFILPDGHGVPIIPVSIGALTVNSIVKCVFVEFDHVMYVYLFVNFCLTKKWIINILRVG